MATTIGCLNQLYQDVAVYNRISKRLNTSGTYIAGGTATAKKTEVSTKSSSTTTIDWMCIKS